MLKRGSSPSFRWATLACVALAVLLYVAACTPFPPEASSRTDVFEVSGTFFEDPAGPQTQGSLRVELDPIFVLPGYASRGQVGAPYAIVLLDAAGVELTRHPFSPTLTVPGGFLNFREQVPFDSRAAEVRIEFGANVLAAVHPGPSAPRVRIVAPVGGEVLSGSRLRVSWAASDPDGDELAFLVVYSDDDFQTYSRVGGPVRDHEVLEHAINLEAYWGGTVRVRVYASDGIHTTYADSDGAVTLAGATALAFIEEPNGPVRISPGETLVLLGSWMTTAEDYEGFEVRQDGQFTWTSDLDGFLSGAQSDAILLKSVGTHAITLTVTDGVHMATDQVRVEVVAGPN